MVTAGTPNLAATAGAREEKLRKAALPEPMMTAATMMSPTITRVIRPLPMPALLAECSRVSMAPMALRDSAKSSAQTMSATTGPNTLPMPSRKLDSPAKAVRTERVRSSSHSMPIKTDSSMATSTLTLMLVTRSLEKVIISTKGMMGSRPYQVGAATSSAPFSSSSACSPRCRAGSQPSWRSQCRCQKKCSTMVTSSMGTTSQIW